MVATPQGVTEIPYEPAPTSVADLLLRAAQLYPNSGLFFVVEEGQGEAAFLSYPALLGEVRRILGGLRTRASHPHGIVTLLLNRPRDFIPCFWACVLGGYVPCPMAPIKGDPERWTTHLAHIASLLDRPLFISSGELLQELPDSIETTDLSELRKCSPEESILRARLSDPAILMLTSGSTGNSKAVELTHGNLLSSLTSRAERQKLTSRDITFNWIAFDHVAALLESHMIALYVGATQLHCEPASVLSDPVRFLSLIHYHRVSLAFAPNFLLGQVNAAIQAISTEVGERPLALDLSCLRRIVTGGEANVTETGRRFLELLAPYGLSHDALWPAFGMTETCAASIYSHEFPEIDKGREFAAVGVPLRGLQIRMLNEDGTLCPPGKIGELQLSGPMIFHRYYNNEPATRAAFTDDGWFRTGDVGYIDGGRLRLIARSKDSIIVSGVNYFSHELETRLESLQGVQQSFVAAFPTRPKGADTEKLVVTFATTLQEGDDGGLYQLVVAIRNTTIMLWGFRPALIIPLPEVAFPKTSLGKIQRSLMRKRLEAGELDAYIRKMDAITTKQVGPFTVPVGPLEASVAKIFSSVLGVDASTLSTSSSFFDLGGTSLDILKLVRLLQREFGLNATLPRVLQSPSVRGLAKRIVLGERSRSADYDPVIPLQLSGTKTPLFCIHPGNGEVFVLVNVAKYFLNDRPFYALRPRGFNEGEQCFQTIEEMVNEYVSAIVKCQPEGPCAIAGYSLGCPIAFEVAKALEIQGRQIAFLGCIDFGPRHTLTQLEFNMATGLALVLDLIDWRRFQQLNRELRPEVPDNRVCEYVLSFSAPARLSELDLDLQKFSTWARVAHHMETMLFAHVNTGTVKTMTIFRGEGIATRYLDPAPSTKEWRDEIARWSEFVERPRYVDVHGNHHAMIGPKHVATFQAIFRTEIDMAFKRHRDAIVVQGGGAEV